MRPNPTFFNFHNPILDCAGLVPHIGMGSWAFELVFGNLVGVFIFVCFSVSTGPRKTAPATRKTPRLTSAPRRPFPFLLPFLYPFLYLFPFLLPCLYLFPIQLLFQLPFLIPSLLQFSFPLRALVCSILLHCILLHFILLYQHHSWKLVLFHPIVFSLLIYPIPFHSVSFRFIPFESIIHSSLDSSLVDVTCSFTALDPISLSTVGFQSSPWIGIDSTLAHSIPIHLTLSRLIRSNLIHSHSFSLIPFIYVNSEFR